jgi:hypothetical protein
VAQEELDLLQVADCRTIHFRAATPQIVRGDSMDSSGGCVRLEQLPNDLLAPAGILCPLRFTARHPVAGAAPNLQSVGDLLSAPPVGDFYERIVGNSETGPKRPSRNPRGCPTSLEWRFPQGDFRPAWAPTRRVARSSGLLPDGVVTHPQRVLSARCENKFHP